MWKAKQMSKIRDFQASTGWCRRFLMRNERARIAVEMNRFIPSQYKSNHFDDYSEKLRESNLQYNKQKYKLLQEENEYMSRMKDES
jgi:hypothetical protein